MLFAHQSTPHRPTQPHPPLPTRHQYDTEFTLDFSNLRSWVDDVKLIIQKDLFRDGATRARYLGAG